jgi:abequosyltransferase
MNIILTICIPIYNCAEFIGQALDSILPQTTGEIEVIVYDGGSTDSTASVMNSYVSNWTNLHYFRGAKRGGIDADLVKCVSFAQGEYCWLFSGDDVMRPNAIERALECITKKYDIYLCKHTICSKNMEIYHEHPVLSPDEMFVANLDNSAERREWFKRAVTSEAFFSFISGLIVRRKKWLSGELPEEFNGSCWGHVARFFGLVPAGLSVCYMPEVLLDQRGDNDSFADKGMVNRFRIAIEGYHGLANRFFGVESNEAFNIRRVIRKELTLRAFLGAKYRCYINPTRENKQLLDKLFTKGYSDSSFSIKLKKLLYKVTTYRLLLLAKFVYQPLKFTLRAIRRVPFN